MTKMEGIAAEVSQKLKSAIKAKLMELGAYVDDELPNYVMVMVTNRRSKAEMDRELQLFLGANTSPFTSWLQSVWQKLEQVTITNSGIDGKRRTTDKKKKAKKSSKSSSESEDDKKHKKKRKSSASDSVSKDLKKRKLQSKESDSCKSESKKKDNDLLVPTENNSDSDEPNENNEKVSKDKGSGSGNEEEDFLNIKADFESEFLSDNEYSEVVTKSKTSPVDAKKSQKIEVDASSKTITLRQNKDNIAKTAETKESTDKNKMGSDCGASKNSVSKISKDTKPTTGRKPLMRDYKARSPLKSKSHRLSPSLGSKSRSRSKSPSQGKIIQLKRRISGSASGEDIDEDFNTKIQRSRLKSVSASSGSVIVHAKSRSRSRSPLMSAATKKLQNQKSSSVLDARELINRKRAMSMVNEPATKAKNELGIGKTTTTGGKIIRIRDREHSKENCRVGDEDSIIVEDDWPEDNDQVENIKSGIKLSKNSGNKFVISRSDGKRSIVVQSSTNSLSNKHIDLRGIKRTVFIDDDSAERDDDDDDDDTADDEVEVRTTTDHVNEKLEKKKKLMDHVLKHIKPDKTVASTVVKLPKPPRPKTSPAQSASSTLIRKAMADAHKSLTNLKDDVSKKKEMLDNKTGKDRSRDKNTIQPEVFDDENPQNRNEIDDEDDERLSTKSTRSSIDHMNDNYDEDESMNKGIDPVNTPEEYEPSISMPQFVVTLTGLDSKLFPKDDTDELMDTLNDDLEPDMTDSEEINITKPKPQERCKYYPNCLAGDQCLYYHPTIPCKAFPNCKFGNNCLYVHPKCKFDSMCTRYDCTFLHTASKVVPPVPTRHAPTPTMMNAQPCKFYYNCVNPVCPFQHPKICRFDRFCTNKNCTFSHTSLTHVSMVSKDKLKWSRPKDMDLKAEPDNEMSVQ